VLPGVLSVATRLVVVPRRSPSQLILQPARDASVSTQSSAGNGWHRQPRRSAVRPLQSATVSRLKRAITELETGSLHRANRHLAEAIRAHSIHPNDFEEQPFAASYCWAVMGMLKTALGDALAGAEFSLHGLRSLNLWMRRNPTFNACDAGTLAQADCLAALGLSLAASRKPQTGLRCLARAGHLHSRGGDTASSAADQIHIALIDDQRSGMQFPHDLLQTAAELDRSRQTAALSGRQLLIQRLLSEIKKGTSPDGRRPLEFPSRFTDVIAIGQQRSTGVAAGW